MYVSTQSPPDYTHKPHPHSSPSGDEYDKGLGAKSFGGAAAAGGGGDEGDDEGDDDDDDDDEGDEGDGSSDDNPMYIDPHDVVAAVKYTGGQGGCF